ncbi:MAG: HlyD family efflux transporter periplasmic adaptor subunit [Desulfarculaceae bacterium]|nr:HlyD family efflux transporter periplasmic adaptor subunit [Desulfarculaceae bacterium]MCF8071954.1 HlyD family efflux transporter periplasmic adaptor subunit [Desulfarculaceae bacterium]MCF8101471.1 HlyD family efflux transporter periplasmic adaptor subunit [Desulfarculaceae bacterium]MCF8115021.1 HlyD family efflux transporter periplasmic adaptor subunit [Desulfarculaceae bacterium]
MAEPTPSCQNLVQDLPQAIMGLGAKGRLDQINAAAGDLLGVDPAQAMGKDFSQVFADRLANGDELFKTIATAQTKGTSLDGLVIPLDTSGGKTLRVAVHTRPMPEGGLAVMLQDVSRQEEAREAQQKQRDLAANLALKAEQKFTRLEQSLKGSKRLRLLAVLLVLVLFGGVGYWAWTRTNLVSFVDSELGRPKHGNVQQNLYTVREQPLSSSISLSGSIKPFETINLLSPFAGRIMERHFEYGQKVKKGALLLKLETSELELKLRDAKVASIKAEESYQKLLDWKNSDAVLQAQRGLQKAQNDLEVTEQKLQESSMLYKRGIIPLDEYRSLKEQVKNQKISLDTLKDQLRTAKEKGSKRNLRVARLQKDNAESKLAKLQKQINRSRITAPVVGVVIKPIAGQSSKESKVVEVGYQVSQGQALLALGNLERLSVSTQVGQLNVVKLRPGQKVLISSYAFPGLSLEGKIESVSSQASQASSDGPPTFTVKVVTDKLNAAEQGKLRLGMSANLQVVIFSKPKVLVVPIDAVHSGPKGGKTVTLKLPKGGNKEAPVKTGVTTPSLVEITSGLKPGDQVALPAGMPGS